MKNTVLTLASLAAALAANSMFAQAHAANEVWSNWHRIEYLQPAIGGGVSIKLTNGDTVSCPTGGGPSNVNPFMLFSTAGANNAPVALDGGYDRVYSMLVSALLSDREVLFRLAPATDGTACYVERIRVR